MKVTGTIVDESTDKPLPAASVSIVDATGKPVQGGMSVNNKGEFSISSPLLDEPNRFLLFSHVSYMSVIATPAVFNANDYPEVGLQVAPKELEDVVVTATIKRKSKNIWLWLIIGALIIAGSKYAKKKKKSINGLSSSDWQSLAIKAGIAMGVYFLVIVPILQKLGILKGKDDKAVIAARDKALKDELQKQLQKQASSYTDAQLSGFADTVFESMRYSWLDDDYDVTEEYLKKMRNTTDVLKLIDIFGKRDECLFGVLCTTLSLPEMVKRNLKTSMISDINKYYESKGIDFNW